MRLRTDCFHPSDVRHISVLVTRGPNNVVQPIITPEECARRILQRELGRIVTLNDDGSAPGMYDLRVGDGSSPEVAIECVGAVDPVRTETWNIGPAQGPVTLQLRGDWCVTLQPHARIKALRQRLESVLRTCEVAGIDTFTPVDAFLEVRDRRLYSLLQSLHIHSVHCLSVEGTGTVHLGMTGFGGAVDTRGQAVPDWISEFLRDPARADVIRKLKASAAQRCHAFVIVSFGGVPWPVESYLGTDTDHLPVDAPDLPVPVDEVWIMYGRNGLRWDGQRWQFFNALVPAN
jgi:hypothetical protein